MAGGLLILTFHKPSATGAGTFAEDLLFKTHALDSPLIDVDAIEQAGPPDKDLFALPSVPGSGLIQGLDATGKPLITFNNVGAAAWARQPFRKAGGTASRFDDWMRKVFSTPIECLVLAGHHSMGILWGLETVAGNQHRPYTALVPNPSAKTIEVRGHAVGNGTSAFLRGGPYDVATALKTCRLLLIWGCNGASGRRENWQPWHDLVKKCSNGKAPVILGHYETHLWPRDTEPKRFSADFWGRLNTLAGTTHSITSLCEQKPREVIELWAATMKAAFNDSKHCNQHMLFQKKYTKECKGYGPRGAGGVDPSGVVFHVINANGDLKSAN